jgi:hypothetical protein
VSKRYETVRRTHDRKQQRINEWKAERGCRACGERDPVVLDAHHRDPATKNNRLKHGSNGRKNNAAMYRLGWDALEAELAKCDVLCANCHRREWAHMRRRGV